MEGYDAAYTIAHTLRAVISRKIDLTLYTDSRSLYGHWISLARTSERCLQIDLVVIQHAYERRNITGKIWISEKTNPADRLRKVNRRGEALE